MILDADILIDLLREKLEAEFWLRSLSELPPISGMAVLEALYGAQNLVRLRKVEGYVSQFPIHWPTGADAKTANRLTRFHLSDGIDMIDMMTASIALRNNLPLATFNVKHYRAIPGLSTIQPYAR